MIPTKLKNKSAKDETTSIGLDKLDPLMIAYKWNITQTSSQSKAQASVYKIEIFDKT